MAHEYPEFRLRLPGGGPEARGRLLTEKGTNGSQKFVVLAGSPGRPEVVPSFPVRMPSSYQDPHHLDVAAAIRMKHGLRQTAGQRLFPAGSRIATHSTWCVTGKRSKARSRRGV
ncbi:hypothetical protein GCM10010246_28670 [Streptomyces cuspidosporus]|uniref:Uncharacterized protein n=1 Tax=Streptomyces cuspidosporus TaxID=66882 RepID=A0ABN3G0Q4_9ACTN